MLKYLDKNLILKIDKKMNKEEVLNYMIDLITEKTKLVNNKESLKEKIFARESLGTTGIGRGVAVPHARMEEINDIIFSIALMEYPIEDYLTPDSEIPKIIVLVASPKSKNSEYLKLLSDISRWFRVKENRDNLILALTTEDLKEELLSLLGE